MARGKVPASSVLKDLLTELKQGWPVGLTLLTGEDLFHLERAQRALLETLVPADASDLGLTIFGEQRVDLGTVIAAVRSVGMFSDRRVVLVRDVAALDGDPDPLTTYAAKPSPDSYLIVRAPSLDRRRKLHQALVKGGRTLQFDAVDPLRSAGLAGEVAVLAGQKNLKIDRTAAGFLAELCAGDFYRIDTELQKIDAWIGADANRRVDVEGIREVASGSGLLSGWEMAAAIVRRDRSAALAAVRQLLDAGDEPLRVLGGVAFKARSMIQARGMMNRGMPAGDAVRAARLFGDSPQRMAQGLARYSMAEVLRFPAHLLEADRTLKSRSLAPRAVLENLVDRMIPERADRP